MRNYWLWTAVLIAAAALVLSRRGGRASSSAKDGAGRGSLLIVE